jgi:hypothetical protein
MPKNAPSDGEDAQLPGRFASKKRRGSMSSNSKPVEVPRKKLSVLRSVFWEPHFNDNQPAQLNLHPLHHVNKRNELFGSPIADRSHGFDSEVSVHPIEVGNPATLHDVFNNDGSQTPGISWHTSLASQQIRALRLPQPWLSEKRSVIQRPMQGDLSNEQPHSQRLPQSFVTQKISHTNPNYQPFVQNLQHNSCDGQNGDNLQVPNNMPPFMASLEYQRSSSPISIHRHPSGLLQPSTLRNSGEYRGLPNFQFPSPQQSGDACRYSAPEHVAYDQGFREQFPVFQPSGQISANSKPLSTSYETSSYSPTMNHRAVFENMMPIVGSGWQPVWDLQQVFGHSGCAEQADDFGFDSRDNLGHAGDMPLNCDGQNEHISPATTTSITTQESSNPPPLSIAGVTGQRAGIRRSRHREDVQILEDGTINHNSSHHTIGIIGNANFSAMVPIAATGITRRVPNTKIDVSILPAYQHLTAPASNTFRVQV